MDQNTRRHMSQEKSELILKVVVKKFFIEKEVTSTLVMDSLYSGLKALESQNKGKECKGKYSEAEELPVPIVGIEKDIFILVDDVLLLLERVAMEPLPPKDEKGSQHRTKDGTAGEDFNKDSTERDERRLTELGRRTIEIFVLAHILSKIDVAYQEAVALKMSEELIREENEQKSKRGVDKEKKSKKKQGKQKKNNRKAKDKVKDDKTSSNVQDKFGQDSTAARKEIAAEPEFVLENPEIIEDASDASGSMDCVPEILLPDSDDRDVSPVNWDTDTSEVQPPMEAGGNETSSHSGVQNGTEGRFVSAVDDSCSTCSSDSVPSVRSMTQKANPCYDKNKKSPNRGRNHQSKMTSGSNVWVPRQPFEAFENTRNSNDSTQSPIAVEHLSPAAGQSLQEKVRNGNEKKVAKKDEKTGSLHKVLKTKDTVDVEEPGNNGSHIYSSPKNPSNGSLVVAPLKMEMKNNAPVGALLIKKPSSDNPKQEVLWMNSSENTATLKPVPQKFETSRSADKTTGYQKHIGNEKLPAQEVIEPVQLKFATTKPAEKSSGHQKPVGSEKLPAFEVPITSEKPSVPPIPVMSRPLSAPIVPDPRPAVSMVSMVQTAPLLVRSLSAAGRLDPETTAYGTHSYVPQSYRNAMMGSPLAGSSASYSQNHSASSALNTSHSYSNAPVVISAPMFSPHSSNRMDPNQIKKPSLSFGMVSHDNMLQNGTLLIDRPQRDGSRNLRGDHNSLVNEMQSFDLNTSMRSRPLEHLPSEFPACTSGRQNHVFQDEFPHLAIINDLLDDEHGVGENSDYQMFSHHINRQYSFPVGDPGMSSPSMSMCRFERTLSYQDDGFQNGYGASGRTHDTLPLATYVNGQVDDFMHNQWQMAAPELNIRNMESAGYPYDLSEYPNLSGGINGYTMFRPSNGL